MTDGQNIICWSKWMDPLGRNQDEFEYVPEKDVESYDNDQDILYDEEDDIDADNPTPVVITPMGILPLKPFNDPTKVFNFWLGETNFNITDKVAGIINTTPGVEIFDVFTRYKFRIAVGNCFKFQSVRQDIEQRLNATRKSDKKEKETENMILDDETRTQVQQIIQVQLAKFPYWAIYVCPNGQIDMAASHEKGKEFNDRIDVYVNARKLAGGAIFKYDEQFV